MRIAHHRGLNIYPRRTANNKVSGEIRISKDRRLWVPQQNDYATMIRVAKTMIDHHLTPDPGIEWFKRKIV